MPLFANLAVILGLAAVGGIVAKLLRQPPVVGYMLAGILVSFLGFLGGNRSVVESFSQLGVTLLLFMVGLELPLNELGRLGKTALQTGIGQIIVTSLVGFVLVSLLGFELVPAVYIALSLAFGSTVIVVKILSEKKDLQSLYGRVAVGFLLVQDFVAIGVMVILSGLSGGQTFLPLTLAGVIVKGFALVLGASFLSTHVFPKVLGWLSKNSEILFVVSLAWCLIVAAVVASPLIGFTVELGGFLAGLTLAGAIENLQIMSRIRPLRDFFMTLFFVALGASINLASLPTIIFPALLLSVFVLIGNPLILMAILGMQGFKKRISFMAGVTVAQVSEFSLVMMNIALKLGHINERVLSLVALVSLVTMLLSSYLISYSNQIYKIISKYLSLFERKSTNSMAETPDPIGGEIVLFGHNRVGGRLRPVLQKLTSSLLIIDFDPQILEDLKKLGVKAVYGDISDYELYAEIGLANAQLVISTVSDIHDNLQLLSFLQSLKKRAISVVLAQDNPDAVKLYDHGADYVLVPHTTGGDLLAQIISQHGLDKKYISAQGAAHLQRICALK